MKWIGLLTYFLAFNANALEPRSYAERIFSPAYMSGEQTVKIKMGNEVKNLTLSSHLEGHKLKTEVKRSIVLIDNLEQMEIDLAEPLVQKIKNATSALGFSNYYVFANFVHSAIFNPSATDFYIAVIPKAAKVDKVFFHIEWFGAGVGAHNQIRMILNQPITLIPQLTGEKTVTLNSADLIYTLQAVRAEGGDQNWDPLKGTMGEFANALQMYSTPSKARTQITTSVIESYELLGLTEAQRKQIFEKAITTSNNEQEAGIYNTIFNSCVTHALIALKVGMPNIDIYHFNPYSVLTMLQKQHPVNLQATQTLNEEFAPLVADRTKIMTWDRIRQTPGYVRTQPFLPIVQTPGFDRILRAIGVFIAEEKITYPVVRELVNEIKSGKPLNQIAKSPEGQKFIERLSAQWRREFPNRDIKQFFDAAESLKSQQ